MRIEYYPAAKEELIEIVLFLEARRPGQGIRFDEVVKKKESHLLLFPRAGTPEDGGFRKLAMREFPYTLHYEIDGDVIRIITVAHQHREPGYWLARIREKDA